MIKKTLQPTNDMYLQFTEEELQILNMNPGDKFEVKHRDDGSIELRPYVKLELDMEEWPREVLEYIVKESCEKDISANDVINSFLKDSLKTFENTSGDSLKSEFGYTANEAVLPTAYNDYTTASSDTLFTATDYNFVDSIKKDISSSIDPSFTNNDISIGNHPNRDNVENDMMYRSSDVLT